MIFLTAHVDKTCSNPRLKVESLFSVDCISFIHLSLVYSHVLELFGCVHL